jgi:hypothetical protein
MHDLQNVVVLEHVAQGELHDSHLLAIATYDSDPQSLTHLLTFKFSPLVHDVQMSDARLQV